MLTEAQHKARKGKLTGSRIACLMTGDAEKIDRLYREMIGEELPEDLSAVWPVRLGEVTEALNLEWFERKQRAPVTRTGEVVNHPYLSWAAVTLDGWSDQLKCVVETKHVGGREPLEVIIDRYQPQLQWLMECTGAERCALSVIVGAAEPVIEFIERDASYADEMIKRGAQFMACVRERRPPVALEAVPPPIDHDKLVDIDMTDNEKWQFAAQQWVQVAGAVETGKNMEKTLKALMPENARKAFGWGCQITRSKANALSLRVQQ